MNRIIRLEFKRHINKTGFAILALFILSVLFLNYLGIRKNQKLDQVKHEFIQNEIQKVNNYNNYSHYGRSGFKLLFMPIPIGAMFNPTTLSNLQSTVDTAFRFDISNPQNGEYIFQRSSGLSWFFLIIMGGFSLTLGWLALQNREYLKMLTIYCSKFFVYLSVLIASAILLFLTVLILTAFSLAQYFLFGINFNGSEIIFILKFLLFTFGILFVLFMLGFALGTMKSTLKSGLIVISCWLILLNLWPHFFNSTFSEKFGDIRSIYSIEAKKVSLLSEFEKKMIEYVKDKTDKNEATKEFLEKFLNEGLVEKLDRDLIYETDRNAKKYHLWSIINSATFYESVCNELSSKGFNEHQRFCKKSLIKKREFIRYCFYKTLQNQHGKAKPFLEGDEYIFYAKSSLPKYFWPGVLVQFFYILVLFLIGYSGFQKILTASEKELKKAEINKFEFDKEGINVWFAKDKRFVDAVFSIFSNKQFEKFQGQIQIREIADSIKKFVYICRPDVIPGNIRVRDLLAFYGGKKYHKILEISEIKPLLDKTFSELSDYQRFSVLLSILSHKEKAIYLLDDIDYAVDPEFTVKLDDSIENLKKQGSLVIFVSRSAVEAIKPAVYVYRGLNWVYKIGFYRTELEYKNKGVQK